MQPIWTDQQPVDLVKLCTCPYPCGEFPDCLGWLDADDDRVMERESEPEAYDASSGEVGHVPDR